MLQYIDLALLSKWSIESHHRLEASIISRSTNSKNEAKRVPKAITESSEKGLKAVSDKRDGTLDFRDRLWFGWCTMWSFRHLNSSYETKNVPPFSRDDPQYIPDQWRFILRQTLRFSLNYVIIDLIESQEPPPQQIKETLFDPALIPVFRRLNSLTSEQVIMRMVSTAGFWLNLYCMIQGTYAAASVIGVSSSLSGVRDWRPMFGKMADAWTLREFWGYGNLFRYRPKVRRIPLLMCCFLSICRKYWHQGIRRILTEPSIFLTHTILRLPEHSLLERYTNMFLIFTLSGVLHAIAILSMGVPLSEVQVLKFFCAQVVGIMIEDGIQTCYKLTGEAGKGNYGFSFAWIRCIGYVWVAGFLIWSSPAWFYPLAVRPAVAGQDCLLPFSILDAVKRRYQASS